MIRVAIFEDNREIREFLAETVRFSEELFLVGAYPNTKEVLQNIKKDKPDVVLMDINLGDERMDGLRAMRLIKQNAKYKRVKIIALISNYFM